MSATLSLARPTAAASTSAIVRVSLPVPAARVPGPVPRLAGRLAGRTVPGAMPDLVALPLSGRYEVVLPYNNGVIFFTDSLAEAARHVATARWGNPDKAGDVLAFLLEVEKLGFLGVGTRGVRCHHPLKGGKSWMATVRGTQLRPGPLFAVDEIVEATSEHAPLPVYLWTGRELRVYRVSVLNDPRPGKQYTYTVGITSGLRLKENRLRPLTPRAGELDFEELDFENLAEDNETA